MRRGPDFVLISPSLVCFYGFHCECLLCPWALGNYLRQPNEMVCLILTVNLCMCKGKIAYSSSILPVSCKSTFYSDDIKSYAALCQQTDDLIAQRRLIKCSAFDGFGNHFNDGCKFHPGCGAMENPFFNADILLELFYLLGSR